MGPARVAEMEHRVADRPMDAPDRRFSLLDDPLLRLQRWLRLAPRHGFGAVRRSVFLVLLTWIPVMVWVVATGQLREAIRPESIVLHLGMHVRCLLAIPLLLLSEPIADRVLGILVDNFQPSGLIRSEDRSRFAAAIRSIERLRDAKMVWAVIAAAAVVMAMIGSGRLTAEDRDALVWTHDSAAFDFGASWSLFVVRPVFLFLLLAWLWRLGLTWVLFRRIASIELQLVASHPDRVGGLGFVALHSVGFSFVVLAVSSVVSVAVAHQMLAHGAHFAQFGTQLVVLVVFLTAVFLSPLSAFSSKLWRVGLRGRFQYGTLAGRHLRGLHARWVDDNPVEDDILTASEIGPAADVATLYGLGTRMLIIPFGKVQLGALLLPAIVPPALVATLEFPFKDILVQILKTIG
jgi:hypothetical protein